MRKRMAIVLSALCLSMLFVGCTDAEQEEQVMISYEQISQEQAKMLMDSESDYVILDVRTEEEFAEGYIAGAILIPDYEIKEKAAHTLAARIEQEWYDSYRLAEQNMYDADAFLPEDLYVFDASMKWCVVFTHETTDWESEIDNPMKAAQTRYCIICKV